MASQLSSNWLKLKLKTSSNKVTKNERTKRPKRLRTNKNQDDLLVSAVPKMSVNEKSLWTKETDIKEAQLDPVPKSLFSLAPSENLNAKKRQPGKFLAIDCEFVGVGPEGTESELARVSIVNFYGVVILDTFVKPRDKVTDWRTWVSGVSPKDMKNAITFKEAQTKCSDLFKDRILVGHAIHHDLTSLFISHPLSMIRDTSRHLPYRKIANGKTPSLKKLTKEFLKIDIQGAEHSSVEDARATMLLYRLQKDQFELALKQKSGSKNKHSK